jgi:tRNA (guanine-N7-)-methyltransferase
MRLRNVKNKKEIMDNSSYLVKDPTIYKGKWNSLFNNSNPIYIEIGMGKGQFIINNALAYPNINFIGIEKYDSVIAKGLQKIPEGLDNLVMIRWDALGIDDILDKEIDRIYLNFSDPWPKKRHHLRRLSSRVFLEKYENIFKDKRIIEMRTDNRDLFQYSLVSFSEFGYTLEDVSLDLHTDNMPDITTEYEDKFSKDGMPIYYVMCNKDVNK